MERVVLDVWGEMRGMLNVASLCNPRKNKKASFSGLKYLYLSVNNPAKSVSDFFGII
jgi:hypothetical protein